MKVVRLERVVYSVSGIKLTFSHRPEYVWETMPGESHNHYKRKVHVFDRFFCGRFDLEELLDEIRTFTLREPNTTQLDFESSVIVQFEYTYNCRKMGCGYKPKWTPSINKRPIRKFAEQLLLSVDYGLYEGTARLSKSDLCLSNGLDFSGVLNTDLSEVGSEVLSRNS